MVGARIAAGGGPADTGGPSTVGTEVGSATEESICHSGGADAASTPLPLEAASCVRRGSPIEQSASLTASASTSADGACEAVGTAAVSGGAADAAAAATLAAVDPTRGCGGPFLTPQRKRAEKPPLATVEGLGAAAVPVCTTAAATEPARGAARPVVGGIMGGAAGGGAGVAAPKSLGNPDGTDGVAGAWAGRGVIGTPPPEGTAFLTVPAAGAGKGQNL